MKILDRYKKILPLISVYSRQFFFTFFCFGIYEMVDSQYRMDIYIPVIINIGTVTGNPEMLKCVPDYLKTKKMCKHAVKNYFIY